jgi:RNA polymerase-interacting CarD/CdnL/TRCF family regulator
MKTFKIGDWVVHVNYGVGQVKDLEKKRISGKDTLYYRVKGQSGTFWFPVKNADNERIRPVVSKRRLQKAIRALGDRPQKMDESHKKRQTRIKEVRSEGSLVSTACLVRDLSYSEAEKELSVTEQNALEELKKSLVMEWSVVSKIEPEEVRTRLDQKLTGHKKKFR